MFLPGRNIEDERNKQRKIFDSVEELCLSLIDDITVRKACYISVQEVQCGDPECAPIDTVITITFDSGGQGIIGLPMEAKEITTEILEEEFPPADILFKWYNGIDAEWPPEPEPPQLRFSVGTAVLCRVGPTDWAPGVVSQLWYRENQWPEDTYAPYKIHLQDGRDIFAPQDMDQIIRLNPNGNNNNNKGVSEPKEQQQQPTNDDNNEGKQV